MDSILRNLSITALHFSYRIYHIYVPFFYETIKSIFLLIGKGFLQTMNNCNDIIA